MTAMTAVGPVTVIVATSVQPLSSVAVTVCVPAPRSVAIAVA